ncbi:hypothetical protein OAU50_07735 [Planctomycetota bacterium]|nr:hypothetical protein [Planctomycetota bacterium]
MFMKNTMLAILISCTFIGSAAGQEGPGSTSMPKNPSPAPNCPSQTSEGEDESGSDPSNTDDLPEKVAMANADHLDASTAIWGEWEFDEAMSADLRIVKREDKPARVRYAKKLLAWSFTFERDDSVENEAFELLGKKDLCMGSISNYEKKPKQLSESYDRAVRSIYACGTIKNGKDSPFTSCKSFVLVSFRGEPCLFAVSKSHDFVFPVRYFIQDVAGQKNDRLFVLYDHEDERQGYYCFRRVVE